MKVVTVVIRALGMVLKELTKKKKKAEKKKNGNSRNRESIRVGALGSAPKTQGS